MESILTILLGGVLLAAALLGGVLRFRIRGGLCRRRWS